MVEQWQARHLRIEDDELAIVQPFVEIRRDGAIVRTISFRFAVADELHFEAMIAVRAAENQCAGFAGREKLEAFAGGYRFLQRNAIRIAAVRADRFAAFVWDRVAFRRSSPLFSAVK